MGYYFVAISLHYWLKWHKFKHYYENRNLSKFFQSLRVALMLFLFLYFPFLFAFAFARLSTTASKVSDIPRVELMTYFRFKLKLLQTSNYHLISSLLLSYYSYHLVILLLNLFMTSSCIKWLSAGKVRMFYLGHLCKCCNLFEKYTISIYFEDFQVNWHPFKC